jgi:hypothetical protein
MGLQYIKWFCIFSHVRLTCAYRGENNFLTISKMRDRKMTIDKQVWIYSNGRLLLVSALTGVLLASAAQGAEKQGIQAGPGTFYPNAGLDVYYDDNLLSQESDTIDSMVTVLSASGREEVYGDASNFALEAGLDRAWYNSSPDDNYLDGRLFGEMAFFPSSRVSASAKGGYWRMHEDRGTTTLQGGLATLQDEPDTYDLWSIEGGFGYGVDEVGAPKIELRASYQMRDYTNNRRITQFRDRDTALLGATFKYMLMSATSLLVDGQYQAFDYNRDEAQLDSEEYRLLAGVTWEATAATTGYAKLGWQKKSFDSSSRKDDDTPSWDVGVKWSPLTYSAFGLNTERKFDETNGVGNVVDRRETRLSWQHAWKTHLSSNVYYSIGKEEYSGSSRTDDIDSIGLTLDYSMREYLDWQLYYTYRERDSSTTGLDYDRNQLGLQVNFAL